jgi:hypothetical protein
MDKPIPRKSGKNMNLLRFQEIDDEENFLPASKYEEVENKKYS